MQLVSLPQGQLFSQQAKPENKSETNEPLRAVLPTGVVGGAIVGGFVVGVKGLAPAGTMLHLPLLNLKSSTAMSLV